MEKYYGLPTGDRIPIDKKLDDIFQQKTDGFFVDVGAHDGIRVNNTAFLEFHRNWTGILVTPCTHYYQNCKNIRPKSHVVNAACVSSTYTDATIGGNFNSLNGCPDNSPLSMPNSSHITVDALTLDTILSSFPADISFNIDLLTIDTYGYDYEVLLGIDLAKYNPTYILVEMYEHNFAAISEYLQSNNYILYSNLSNFSKQNKPSWSGIHNDYLFVSLILTI
jgi:FkbM family methyltransferase